MRLILADADATERFGAALAAVLPQQALLFLSGDLGAGKTTLTRGLLHALGHRGACRSPTYTLVEPYRIGGRQVYHFDLYRLANPEELEFIGIRDYLAEPAICVIEWPERGSAILPPADLEIELRAADPGRVASLSAAGERGDACLARLAQRTDMV